MPQLAAWDDHPEDSKEHLKQRLRRLPPNGLRRVKDFFRPSREVPAAKWFVSFGNFVAVGNNIYLSSYLGPHEMDEVEGYDLRCWRQNKNNPEKCWRDKKPPRKSK